MTFRAPPCIISILSYIKTNLFLCEPRRFIRKWLHSFNTRWSWVISFTPRPHHPPAETALGINTTGVRVGLRVGLEVSKYTKFSSLSELEPRVLGCSPRSLMATVTMLPGISDDIQNYMMCTGACTSCTVSFELLWPIGRFWTRTIYICFFQVTNLMHTSFIL